MQIHFKAETANKINKCSPEFLKGCSDYYHKGGGKEKQRKWLANLPKDKKERRKETTRLWKARNSIRISLLRFSTNCKTRLCKKNPSFENVNPWEIIGCNVVELQAHIESLFMDGIGWHNRREWEIDHKKPLCEFDLSNKDDAMKCFHFSNIQILEKKSHYMKARKEMDDLARENWSKNGSGPYPGFTNAWSFFCNGATKPES